MLACFKCLQVKFLARWSDGTTTGFNTNPNCMKQLFQFSDLLITCIKCLNYLNRDLFIFTHVLDGPSMKIFTQRKSWKLWSNV